MFPTSQAVTQVVKVTLAGDMRRLRVEFQTGMSASEAFVAVQVAVRQTFDLAETAGLVLKYTDDEEDLCTLAEVSMEDLASLAAGKPWRLLASVGDSATPAPAQEAAVTFEPNGVPVTLEPKVTAVAGDVPVTPEEPKEVPGIAAAQDPVTEDGEESDPEEEGGLPEWDPMSEHAVHMLPFASMMVQSESARSKISTLGVEQREQVLRFARELEDNLDLVPDAAPLRPRLLAYIDGSDPDHFGDVFAELLKAWASSSSTDNVKLSVQMHISSVKKLVMKSFFRGKGKGKDFKGKGNGKGHKGKGKGPEDWARLFEGLGAGGAGGPFAPFMQHLNAHLDPHAGAGEGPLGAVGGWKGALAGMMAQKGLGKGFGVPTGPSESSNPFGAGFPFNMGGCHMGGHMGSPAGWQGMLSSLLANKGQGKGHGCGWPCTPGMANPCETAARESEPQPPTTAQESNTEMSSCTSSPAEATRECEPSAPVAPKSETPAEHGSENFEEQVKQLLEMNLVTDAEVARELLSAHNGDVSKVASVLMG